MDFVIWGFLLLGMLAASYRALLVWENRTNALDEWPEDFVRAVPAIVWLGTAFLVAGAVLVLGNPSDGSPLAILCALVAAITGLGAMGFGISLMVSGRPRRLAPPHLRGHAEPKRAR